MHHGPLMAAVLAALAVPQAETKIRVLIVDGQNNHNYRAMTPFMKDQLEATGRFAVDVSTSPPAAPRKAREETPEQAADREQKTSLLRDAWTRWRPRFKDYQVVVSNYNGEAWPEEVKTSFVDFVRSGGGFYVVHAANNAFPGWTDYDQMIGLGWRDKKYGNRVYYDEAGTLTRALPGDGPGAGHGAQHEYLITVRDPGHPILQGLPAAWRHATDELYHGQRGPAEHMVILASAFDDPSKGGTGVHEPILWVIPFGAGKVVTNVLGHENGKAVQCVGFVTLLLRTCEWLATGKVTFPVPPNFPTADRVSLVGNR